MAVAGTLILICGLPGTGKTTLAKRLESERNAVRMCPDEWIEAVLADPLDVMERDRLRDPVENLQWDLTLSYLQKGLTVILENGFWAEEERSLYLMAALEVGAQVELIYLEAPNFEALWSRVQARNAEWESQTFVMRREELEFGWQLFQAPTPEEMAFYDDATTVAWNYAESV